MKVFVEYEPKQIRHAIAQCPNCKNWFNAYDMMEINPVIESDLEYEEYTCPLCHTTVNPKNDNVEIEEKDHEDFPAIKRKHVAWE